jgi:hypothetical protein
MASKYSSDPAQRARELHAEGRLGGRRFGKMGGRPRKAPASSHPRPAAAAVAEAAAENADLIAKTFADVLNDDSISDTRKITALRTWLGIEARETDRERDEERDELAALSRDEVEEELTRLLGNPMVRDGLAHLLTVSATA